MTDSRSLAVDEFRRDWEEALALTGTLPRQVPERAPVDEVTERLCGHVELLIFQLDKAVNEMAEDIPDRETARWLLVRARRTLADGPGGTDRSAAVRAEDLALGCRALTSLLALVSRPIALATSS
ncbi:DUF6415 family natural product biosynthesis protein [Streptomyces sp. NBC_01235]|uniref:DUF6415 family natural product biosynthesis protein n=1 Tax=Streptomyces sp. NBC_01235 TaxID=2903788 RepID=UPI002E12434C|nr:DUF6415 family natural product biosynthesis protein [Streptomyces sp. NBC_01235]